MLTMKNWNQIDEMHSGNQQEVDAEVFDYFLGVLPPVFMNKNFTFKDGQRVESCFGFAEGYEPITVFWRDGEKYYCRQSSMINPLG